LKAGEACLQTHELQRNPLSGLTGFSLLLLQKTTGFASGFLLKFPAKSRFLLFDVP
jgi:hypothetical protein